MSNTLKQARHGLETAGLDNRRIKPLSDPSPQGTMSPMAKPRTSGMNRLYRHLSSALAVVLLCLGGAAASAAQELSADAEGPGAGLASSEISGGLTDQESGVNLAVYSDQQIGGLLQQWPRLNAIQRRDLLAEVRKRMHAAGESENAPLVSQRAPSLTVRIQRAKTQHRYGKPAPRNATNDHEINQPQAGAESTRAAQPTKPQSLPRDLVIRATVTRTLPDGSVVTTEETLVPKVLAERPATGQSPGTGETGANTLGQQSVEQRSRGAITVVRTKVRFGAGFDRRQHAGETTERNGSSVRTVSTANTGNAADLTQER